MTQSSFETEFVDNLQEVGDILQDNGYTIESYTGNLKIGGVEAAGHGSTPEQALEETLDDIGDEIMVALPGELVRSVYTDEDADLAEALYSNLKGSVEVDQPMAYLSKNGEPIEVDQADTEEDLWPAFGLHIEYSPNRTGKGNWQLETLGTMPGYTHEEARQEVDQIAEVLEENGIEYEIGPIN